MSRRRPLTRQLAALGVAAVLLAACGGGAGVADDVDPATTSTTDAATTSTSNPSTSTTEAPDPVVAPPRRSVWVHLFDDSLKTPAGVEQVIADTVAADLDAVIVQVARRHDAYYDSGYLPPTPDPGLDPGLDVLAAVIDAAAPHGIQVHAWFVIAPAIHPEYQGLTLPDGHLWLDHGPASDDPWMTVDVDGVTSEDYLDVGIEAVHDHTVAIVGDVASRYPVDGVHLDYARYDDARWGYHPAALERFRRDTGRTDRPGVDDPDWVRWRTSRTADLVGAARDELHRHRPGALLSVAVIAGGEGPAPDGSGFAGTRAAARMFQDWPAWLDEDRVDMVFAMAYTREHEPDQARWYRQWVAFAGTLSERHPARVAVGVGAYLNDVDDVLVQLDLADAATGHVAVYSYQQDSADGERGEALRRWMRP
ncbi:MAG: glycoside hydrolase family 10 protein [Acidimicrobiales bacterium]